jgi:hypothetical protein
MSNSNFKLIDQRKLTMNNQNDVSTGSVAMGLIDDVYSVALWMTGDEASAGMLVSQTYLDGATFKNAAGLFKAFRGVYLRSFGQEGLFNTSDAMSIDDRDVARAVIKSSADFKLTTLLADMAELSHNQIADVIEKPVDTVRTWLHWGRKLMSNEVEEKMNVN